MTLLAIDPGSDVSGYVQFEGGDILDLGILDNETLLERMESMESLECAIEFTPPYVMRARPTKADPRGNPYVPSQVFETAVYIGRLSQEWQHQRGVLPTLVSRADVRKHITGKASRVGDKEIRAALIELYGGDGAIGKKATPGPLYGVTSHCWAALAVAVTFTEQRKPEF